MVEASGAPKPQTIWEFPKPRGTLFWGPYIEDPIISGNILGSPFFGNPHIPTRLAKGKLQVRHWRGQQEQLLSQGQPELPLLPTWAMVGLRVYGFQGLVSRA